MRAWESASSEQHATPAAALQIDTFHGADGQAAVSVVCINAQLPVGSANCIALDLVRKILADKVRPLFLLNYLCCCFANFFIPS